MLTFKQFLLEKNQISWNGSPNIGWWEDNDTLTLYHGTHKKNLQSILENGLSAPTSGPTANWVSLALEPNTAFGYASMTGGESSFRAAGSKATTVPKEDRVVIIFKFPISYILSNMNKSMRGNMDVYRDRLKDRSLYDNWKKSDQEYYMTTEIRLPNKVDKKFIFGYTFKN